MGQRLSWHNVFWAVLAMAAVFGVRLAWWTLGASVEGVPAAGTAPTVERPGAALQAAWVLTAVVLAPVVEEIVFRGLIFRRLLRHVQPVLAALGSSLLFGLLHPDPLWSGLFGLAMVALYAQTRSLWVPLVAHALNNAVGTLAGGIWTVLVGKPLWLVIVTEIVCLPWLCWLLWRGLKELSPRSANMQ